jgi:hypothetical protein
VTPVEWAVVLAGTATITWINWYFFFAEKASASAAPGADDAQEG